MSSVTEDNSFLKSADEALVRPERKSEMIRHLVVLTACIDPSAGSAKIVRRDPGVRLQDYLRGLRFWLDHPDPRLRWILFIDNSGHPLDALRELVERHNPHGKTVEFVSVRDNEFPPNVHYGYGELKILDHAMENSELARRAQHVIKATGRLWFPDISRLLDRLPDEFRFAVDSRKNVFPLPRRRDFTTTQLILFQTAFYRETMMGLHEEMQRPPHPGAEGLFYEHFMRYRGKAGCIMRWPVNCEPCGHAAHWEKKYHGAGRWGIVLGRAIARVVAPEWWI